ncbi:PQ-loop repeat-containing protein 3 [Amphibalanus amphitrite]|uniref:PQ-loop repeat-containing protein 3 n=1 Tax=Amphibalanus amphitrite TaxID=1232801 RepID=A0A6A4WWX3_AMPAM|nr:PQ-loop repeat-containing protein 3 [Amphibalanus amphitrite]
MSLWAVRLALLCDWLTIGPSVALKLPQLLSLLRDGSTAGLSVSSAVLELASCSIQLCYHLRHGYILTSYLEHLLLAPQLLAILLLLLARRGLLGAPQLLLLAGAALTALALAAGPLPIGLLTLLLQLDLPIAWSGKVAQLGAVVRARSGRAVSRLTWLLAALTCVTRLLTTLLRTGDRLLLISFTGSLLLNLAVLVAATVFRRRPAD